MKWNRSLPKPGMLVYYLVKFNGLAPFTVKNQAFHAPDLLSKLYPLFVATGYSLYLSVSYTHVLEAFTTEFRSLFMKTWVTIAYFISLPGTLYTLVIFLVMHEKIINLLNTLRTVSNKLKVLGIEEDHEKTFNKLLVTTLLTHIFLGAILITMISMERNIPVIYSIKYCVDSCFNLNIVSIFAQMLIWIRQRFIVVNEKLYDLLKPMPCLRIPHQSRLFIIDIDTEETSRSGGEDLTGLQRIREIQALHFKLCDLVDRTTRLFNVPIIFTSIRYFIILMTCFYRIYLILRKLRWNYGPIKFSLEIAEILGILIEIAIAIIGLLIIAHASATTCEQGNAMRAVLFRVWIKLRPDHLRHEFLKFSHQLLHKPVAVYFFGFLNPDYSFIFKIFCTVTTYLIVVIQIDPL